MINMSTDGSSNNKVKFQRVSTLLKRFESWRITGTSVATKKELQNADILVI